MLWTARTALNFALQLVEFNQKNPRRRDRSLSPDRKRLSHKKILLFALAYVHHFVLRAYMKQPVLLTIVVDKSDPTIHITLSQGRQPVWIWWLKSTIVAIFNVVIETIFVSWDLYCYWRGIFQKRGFLILLLGKNTRKYDKHILRTPSDWHAGSNTVSDASFS